MADITPHRDIIVIGASAGGVEALSQLISQLPKGLDAAIFIVLHIPSQSVSMLPMILGRLGPYPAEHPVSGSPIEYGRIYIAPPNHHLNLLRQGSSVMNHLPFVDAIDVPANGHSAIGTIVLSRGPRENRSRPAIDVLFRTAARSFRERVISIILSGTLNDGTAGVAEVRVRGGITIAQDPQEALYAEMPKSAIDRAGVDHICPIRQIVEMLPVLTSERITRRTKASYHSHEHTGEDMDEKMIREDMDEQERDNRDQHQSVYTCPDCGGVLWEADEGGLMRFRCHLGHAMSAETLMQASSEQVEAALWSAVRILTEKAILSRQLSSRMRERESQYSAMKFEEQAVELEQQVTLLRKMLLSPTPEPPVEP